MFEKNIAAYSIEDQDKLWNSTVIIIGVGGGGGVVAELLVRTGVGHIVLVDGDKYEETNLNRQIGATIETIGQYKVNIIKKRLLSINPLIDVEAQTTYLMDDSLIKNSPDAIICDCSDSKESKMLIADICAKTRNKLVTGGDGAFSFFVAKFMSPWVKNTRTYFESLPQVSNESAAPVTVWIEAGIQAYEVINAILGRNSSTDNKIQNYNLVTYTNCVTEE